MGIYGTDISEYQKTMDWQKHRLAGGRFSFIRATVGLVKDDNFFNYLVTSEKSGVFRTAFHVFKLHRDPIEQAEFFWDTVNQYSTSYNLNVDIPPMIDVESRIVDPEYDNKLKACVERIERVSAWTPVIYTSYTVWNNFVKPKSDWAKRYPLFVAHWGVDTPTLPSTWDSWLFWQARAVAGEKYGSSANLIDEDIFNGGIISFYFWIMFNVFLHWKNKAS